MCYSEGFEVSPPQHSSFQLERQKNIPSSTYCTYSLSFSLKILLISLSCPGPGYDPMYPGQRGGGHGGYGSGHLPPYNLSRPGSGFHPGTKLQTFFLGNIQEKKYRHLFLSKVTLRKKAADIFF
jgi:hypothetical protein